MLRDSGQEGSRLGENMRDVLQIEQLLFNRETRL